MRIPALFMIGLTTFTLAETANAQYRYRQNYDNYNSSYSDNFPNWYLALNGSVSFVNEVEINGNNGDFDTSLSGGNVALGYRPNRTGTVLDNMMFELSLGYYATEADLADAKLKNITPFLNAYYSFDTGGRLRPYIGAGIGASYATLDDDRRRFRGFLTDQDGDGITDSITRGETIQNPDGSVTQTPDQPNFILDDVGNRIPVYEEGSDDSDFVFSYQLMAGLSYEFESLRNTELVVGYRFLDSSDMNFDLSGTQNNFDFTSHNIDVGLRFRF